MKNILNRVRMFMMKKLHLFSVITHFKKTFRFFDKHFKKDRQDIEPYDIEHLKNMIHQLTDDIDQFKYTPYLIEINCMRPINDKIIDHKLYIPFLLDCKNREDGIKVVLNITKLLIKKGYYNRFDSDNDINKYEKPESEEIERMKQLGGDTFFDKKRNASKKVETSKNYLYIDLLEGTTAFKKLPLPINSNADVFEGIRISVEESEIVDLLTNNK